LNRKQLYQIKTKNINFQFGIVILPAIFRGKNMKISGTFW